MGYTHLKASLIEVIDILFKNTIFYYGILNKIKPLVNDLRILTFCVLIIILASILGYELIMLLNESSDPSFADRFPISLI
jgi:hypothetical protein